MLDNRDWVVLDSTKVLAAGSKKPLLSTMMSSTGGEAVAQFAIKPAGESMSAAQVCAEALCSSLAHRMGIPTPLAAVVRLDDPAARQLARPSRPVSPGVAFASQYVDGAAAFKRPPPGYAIEALRIYLFDYLVQNRDRLRYNPNVLYASGNLLVIDHEQCFEFCCRGGEIQRPGQFLTSAAMDAHVFKDVAAAEAATMQAGGLTQIMRTLLTAVNGSVVAEVQQYCTRHCSAPFDWDLARERIRNVKRNVELHAEAIVTQLL